MKRAHVLASLLVSLGFASLAAEAAPQSKPGTQRPQTWSQKTFFPANAKAACIIPSPQVSITPGALAFGMHPPGANVQPQSFTIANTGTAPLVVSSISTNAIDDYTIFSVEGICTFTSIPPGSACVEELYFDTQAPSGSYSRAVQVHSNAAGSPHSLSATGTIGSSGPMPGFQRTPPGTIDLGSAPVGSTTLAQPITITNTGGAPLEIQPPSLGTGSPFYFSSNTCPVPPATVAPGGSCQMEFRMTPASTGPQSGFEYIYHNAPGGVHVVPLAGFGVAPGAELQFDPSSAYFGLVEIGTSATLSVSVTNVGASPLTIENVDLGDGAFTIDSEDCTETTLNTGESCQLQLRFDAPLSLDFYNDTLSITSNAPSSPNSLQVSGEAVNPTPAISPSPGYFDFGSLDVAAPAACTTVTLTNNDPTGAPGPLLYYYMYSSGAFTLAPGAGACPTTCGPSLNGGESCTLGLYFDPSYEGYNYGYLEVFDNNSYSYWYIDLEGNGTLSGPKLDLDQYFLDFGSHPVDALSPPRTVTAYNSGNAPLNISAISNYPNFPIQSTTCIGAPIPVEGSCTITLAFTGASPTSYYETIAISSDAVAGRDNFEAYGVATTGPKPSVDFFPEEMDFGNVVVGQASTARSVSFANTGSAPLTIVAINTTGDTSVTHDCPLGPGTLAPNACCTITGVFTPTVVGSLVEDSISVDTDIGLQFIPLYGAGVPPPSLTISPPALAFPPAVVGSHPPPVEILVTNTGITDITFTGLTTTGDFFLYDPLGPPGIAAPGRGPKARAVARGSSAKAAPLPQCIYMGTMLRNEQCLLSIWFAPATLGLLTGQATINFANGQGSPQVIALQGASLPAASPDIALSTDRLDFGGVVIDTVSPTKPIVISSTGTSALAINAMSVRGPFRYSTNCPPMLEPGLSCVIDVAFVAGALGPAEGDITIEHGAAGVFRRVFFTASGVPVPKPRIVVSATGLVFGNQSVGTPPRGTQRFTVRNAGNAPLVLGGIAATPGFPLTSSCSSTLAPDQECAVEVGFAPSGAGRQVGSVSIPSNDPERATVAVALSGTGCRLPTLASARLGTSACGP